MDTNYYKVFPIEALDTIDWSVFFWGPNQLRLSRDGKEFIVRYRQANESDYDAMSHADALTLMSTENWAMEL